MVGEFSVLLNTIKRPSHLYSYLLEGGGGRGIYFCFKRGFFLVDICLFVVGCIWRGVLLGYFFFPSALGINLRILNMLGRRSTPKKAISPALLVSRPY